MMSKPMAVTLPIVLLLLDIFPLERLRLTKDLPPLFIEKIPLFALSLLGGVLTLLAQSATGAVRTLQETSLVDRVINSFQTLWAYVEKTFWPRDLLPFYPFWENPSLLSMKFLLGLILFLAITLLSFYQWRKGNPVWLVVWLFYLVTLAPVIGIIKVGAQAMADRYTYIPTLSLAFLSGGGLMNLWQHNKFRSGIILVTAIMAFVLSNLSAKQIRIWHDGESLWIPVAEKFPEKAYHAHANLASFYFQEGRLKKAEDQLNIAMKIQPNQVDTLFYLGMVYTDQGRLAEAKELLEKALLLNAKDERVLYRLGVLYEKLGQENLAQNEYNKALTLKPELEPVRLRLGQLYSKAGRFKEAEEQFKKVLELNAESEGARNNLGVLYYQNGRFEQAEAEYLRVIKTWPRKVQAYNNLGILYYETKKYEDAEIIYQKVLELDPSYIEAKNNFGVLNLAMNKTKDALSLLQSSKSMDPNRVNTLYYLGMAYMAERNWLSAQTEFRAALSLNSDNADIYDKLGIVLAQEGKWKKSREAFLSALRLDPLHFSAKGNLQRLENKIIANSQ
jgi:tetratricopeptide (TPR) repeat protein